uniref:Ig-like domain-containing protein n=1 Tax=Salarias fasciatus TaxID=181472 RepID=A0A672H8C5_SALFA
VHFTSHKMSMSPPLKQVFTGDLFYLQCDGSSSHNSVKWYMNDEEQTWTKKFWKIPAAKPQNSGSYRCEVNGTLKNIHWSCLTSLTGQPVAQRHSSVILQLEHEDGLRGWSCRVYRGDKVNIIPLKLEGENDVSLTFQPRGLLELETTFWCTDQSEESRSNQITVRTSEKKVSLEIYHLPAVVGQDVTLRCLVWGTKQISRTLFYRGDEVIAEGNSNTIEILNITDSKEGSYKCQATFTYKAGTGEPYRETSDAQDLLTGIYAWSTLHTPVSVHHSFTHHRITCDKGSQPKGNLTYSRNLSHASVSDLLAQSSTVLIPVVVVLLLIGTVIGCVAFIVWYRRRSAMGETSALVRHFCSMNRRPLLSHRVTFGSFIRVNQ